MEMETNMADVAIIGAGLIGASIAWRLAQAGRQVTLFDAGKLGGEASSAGAGMLSPGGEFDEPSVWLDLGMKSMRLYPAFVEELSIESGMPIDFRICGCLYVVEGEARARAEFQATAGIRVEPKPEGLFYPDDGFVDPGDLLRALRRVFDARGVRVVEHHPVEELDASKYDAVVVGAGAWSGEIRVGVALPPAIPVKGHLIGFQLEPGTLGPMRRHGHTYVLQRSNGFTIAGSTEERVGFDRTIDPAICADIHRRAAQLFPALESATPCRQWIGFRPYSENGPHIGRVADSNVWLAYGHYRNGILLAPLTADRVVHDILSSP
jgi:glycine oxidase